MIDLKAVHRIATVCSEHQEKLCWVSTECVLAMIEAIEAAIKADKAACGIEGLHEALKPFEEDE